MHVLDLARQWRLGAPLTGPLALLLLQLDVQGEGVHAVHAVPVLCVSRLHKELYTLARVHPLGHRRGACIVSAGLWRVDPLEERGLFQLAAGNFDSHGVHRAAREALLRSRDVGARVGAVTIVGNAAGHPGTALHANVHRGTSLSNPVAVRVPGDDQELGLLSCRRRAAHAPPKGSAVPRAELARSAGCLSRRSGNGLELSLLEHLEVQLVLRGVLELQTDLVCPILLVDRFDPLRYTPRRQGQNPALHLLVARGDRVPKLVFRLHQDWVRLPRNHPSWDRGYDLALLRLNLGRGNLHDERAALHGDGLVLRRVVVHIHDALATPCGGEGEPERAVLIGKGGAVRDGVRPVGGLFRLLWHVCLLLRKGLEEVLAAPHVLGPHLEAALIPEHDGELVLDPRVPRGLRRRSRIQYAILQTHPARKALDVHRGGKLSFVEHVETVGAALLQGEAHPDHVARIRVTLCLHLCRHLALELDENFELTEV
mmetsp:Transcript_4851/g.17430  ORF Transcript_4851/g.17430 Transcript_4851/m.17430 type:complete len:484 (+) Transcript_4851:1760-3211(+)